MTWVASYFLRFEIEKDPVLARRDRNLELVAKAVFVPVSDTLAQRSDDLIRFGYGALDSCHLAAAEISGCDALLTTDDRLLRRAARGTGRPQVLVRNPIEWLREVTHAGIFIR